MRLFTIIIDYVYVNVTHLADISLKFTLFCVVFLHFPHIVLVYWIEIIQSHLLSVDASLTCIVKQETALLILDMHAILCKTLYTTVHIYAYQVGSETEFFFSNSAQTCIDPSQ